VHKDVRLAWHSHAINGVVFDTCDVTATNDVELIAIYCCEVHAVCPYELGLRQLYNGRSSRTSSCLNKTCQQQYNGYRQIFVPAAHKDQTCR
jgi:hypothetical protein